MAQESGRRKMVALKSLSAQMRGGSAVLLVRILIGLLLAARTCAAAPSYPFNVESRQDGDRHVLVATNRGPAPVSTRVHVHTTRNIASDRQWPAELVVPPNQEVTIARVGGQEPGQVYSFHFRADYAVGDHRATHQPDARYRLPYEDGRTFTIGQSLGGPITTHTSAETRYAVDIPMPEGTPLVAARDGIVIETESGYRDGAHDAALLDRANMVRILHDDGTIASYAHLAPAGVFVAVGDRVGAGTRIGLAGSTGYSSGPHLHFSVTKVTRTEEGFIHQSVPFSFYVGNPALVFAPLFGTTVKADYVSSGTELLRAKGEPQLASPPSSVGAQSATTGRIQ